VMARDLNEEDVFFQGLAVYSPGMCS